LDKQEEYKRRKKLKKVSKRKKKAQWVKNLRKIIAAAILIFIGIYIYFDTDPIPTDGVPVSFLEAYIGGFIGYSIIMFPIFYFFLSFVLEKTLRPVLRIFRLIKARKSNIVADCEEANELKKLMVKTQVVYTFVFPIFIAMVSLIIIGGIYDNEVLMYGGIIFVLLAPLLVWGLSARYDSKYQSLFKGTIVKSAIKDAFTEVDYLPEKGLDDTVISESLLFSQYAPDKYEGSNFLSATRNNRRFKQSDIKLLSEYTDSEGDTILIMIFSGRLMVFENSVLSQEPVYVIDKRASIKTAKDNIIVQTEMLDFNSRFDVYAKDAISAFRILTPPVMEGIVLATSSLRFPIAISFVAGNLYLLIECGEHFVTSTMGDDTIEEHINTIKEEIQIKTDLADMLYFKSSL